MFNLVSFPVLSQIKPQAPVESGMDLVNPYPQLFTGARTVSLCWSTFQEPLELLSNPYLWTSSTAVQSLGYVGNGNIAAGIPRFLQKNRKSPAVLPWFRPVLVRIAIYQDNHITSDFRGLLEAQSYGVDALWCPSVNFFKFQPCDHTPPRTHTL